MFVLYEDVSLHCATSAITSGCWLWNKKFITKCIRKDPQFTIFRHFSVNIWAVLIAGKLFGTFKPPEWHNSEHYLNLLHCVVWLSWRQVSKDAPEDVTVRQWHSSSLCSNTDTWLVYWFPWYLDWRGRNRPAARTRSSNLSSIDFHSRSYFRELVFYCEIQTGQKLGRNIREAFFNYY